MKRLTPILNKNCDAFNVTFEIIKGELHNNKYTMKVIHEKTGVSMRQIARLLNNQLRFRDKAIRKLFTMMMACVKSDDISHTANRIIYSMRKAFPDSPEAMWIISFTEPYTNPRKNFDKIRFELERSKKR